MLVALTLAVLAAGCGGGDEERGSELTVVATTTQVADLVRNVAGSRADVRQLLHPNSDPHGYEPRPSDALVLSRAKVVFRSGGEVDDWLRGLIESAGGDAVVVTLIDSVRAPRDDPHWWQDPRNAERAVVAIRNGLVRADSSGRAAYTRNAAAYLRRLRKLDGAVARCVRSVPAAERKLVTTHDAFGAFAARYDIEVIGALIPSLSTAAQPSAGDTAKLVDQIREERVKAIFPESSIDAKLERAVSREAGAKVGGKLWADTLGPKGSSAETYIGSIASNTTTLVEGFTGGRVRCRPRV